MHLMCVFDLCSISASSGISTFQFGWVYFCFIEKHIHFVCKKHLKQNKRYQVEYLTCTLWTTTYLEIYGYAPLSINTLLRCFPNVWHYLGLFIVALEYESSSTFPSVRFNIAYIFFIRTFNIHCIFQAKCLVE